MNKQLYIKLIVFIFLIGTVFFIVEFFIVHDKFEYMFTVKSEIDENKEIWLFGSSVTNHVSKEDTVKLNIAQLISENTDIETANLSRAAASLEAMQTFINYGISNNTIPKTAIIPVNLRSFSREWHDRPEYRERLSQEKIYFNYGIAAFIFRKFLPFLSKNNYKLTHNKYNNLPVLDYKKAEHGKVINYLNKDKRNIKSIDKYMKDGILLHYMYSLDNGHLKIQALKNILNRLQKSNVQVICFVTPIDVELCSQYYPIEFKTAISQNIQFIKDAVLSNCEDCVFVDLSGSIPSQYFDHDIRPGEHLNEKGRMFIADTISKYIIKN